LSKSERCGVAWGHCNTISVHLSRTVLGRGDWPRDGTRTHDERGEEGGAERGGDLRSVLVRGRETRAQRELVARLGFVAGPPVGEPMAAGQGGLEELAQVGRELETEPSLDGDDFGIGQSGVEL
jgi:hypothetical protein